MLTGVILCFQVDFITLYDTCIYLCLCQVLSGGFDGISLVRCHVDNFFCLRVVLLVQDRFLDRLVPTDKEFDGFELTLKTLGDRFQRETLSSKWLIDWNSDVLLCEILSVAVIVDKLSVIRVCPLCLLVGFVQLVVFVQNVTIWMVLAIDFEPP